MVRTLMLSDSENKNESDLLVHWQKEAHTLLGRFDQTEFFKTRRQKTPNEKRGRGASEEVVGSVENFDIV